MPRLLVAGRIRCSNPIDSKFAAKAAMAVRVPGIHEVFEARPYVRPRRPETSGERVPR